MKIYVNGELRDVAQNCTAQALIELLNLQNAKVAMEVNQEIVPRSQYNQCTFKENDVVEIVRAIGGG